jgi:hypothetical protein
VDPNCVVLGDAVDGFSYKNLNTAFRSFNGAVVEIILLGEYQMLPLGGRGMKGEKGGKGEENKIENDEEEEKR